jgi:hypothetical protein
MPGLPIRGTKNNVIDPKLAVDIQRLLFADCRPSIAPKECEFAQKVDLAATFPVRVQRSSSPGAKHAGLQSSFDVGKLKDCIPGRSPCGPVGKSVQFFGMKIGIVCDARKRQRHKRRNTGHNRHGNRDCGAGMPAQF